VAARSPDRHIARVVGNFTLANTTRRTRRQPRRETLLVVDGAEQAEVVQAARAAVADLADRDPMQCSTELSVAAAASGWRLVLPEDAGIGATPACIAAALGAEAGDVANLTDNLRGGEHTRSRPSALTGFGRP
jgi:hypothetical protein